MDEGVGRPRYQSRTRYDCRSQYLRAALHDVFLSVRIQTVLSSSLLLLLRCVVAATVIIVFDDLRLFFFRFSFFHFYRPHTHTHTTDLDKKRVTFRLWKNRGLASTVTIQMSLPKRSNPGCPIRHCYDNCNNVHGKRPGPWRQFRLPKIWPTCCNNSKQQNKRSLFSARARAAAAVEAPIWPRYCGPSEVHPPVVRVGHQTTRCLSKASNVVRNKHARHTYY
jgi:hypothetical protein